MLISARRRFASLLVACVCAATAAVSAAVATGSFSSSAGPTSAASEKQTWMSPALGSANRLRLRQPEKTTERVAGNDEPLRFDRVFVDDAEVKTVAAARSYVAFNPNVPPSLDPPKSIVLHSVFRPQALGLVYDDATYGRFVVVEEPSKMTTSDLSELAATCDPMTGCEGSWTMTNLVGQIPSLLISNPPEVTTIAWLQGTTLLRISGPAETLRPDDAIRLATSFVANASS
jgi:hypothetical protein